MSACFSSENAAYFSCSYSIRSCVACGNAPTSSSQAGSSEAAVSSSPGGAAVDVDEGITDVTITLSAEMVELLLQNAEESPEDYVERMESEEGVKDVTLNEDGSVSITMTKAKHREMLDGYKETVDEAIATYTDGNETPSVKSIEYNDDMTVFTVTVDKEAYENSLDGFVQFGLGISGMYYQTFSGVETPQVTIHIVDEATGETFRTVVYPDDLQQTT